MMLLTRRRPVGRTILSLHLLAILAGLSAGRPALAVAADWPEWRGPDRAAAVSGFAPPQAWPAELRKVWQTEVGTGHSSPLVVGNRIYQFSRQGEEETLACLDMSGKVLWRKGYAAPYRMHSAAQGHGKGPKSTPLAAEGRIYTFGISGIVSCWSLADGALQWRRAFDKEFKNTSPLYGAAASPILVDGLLAIHVGGHDRGALLALDARSGEPRWRWDQDGPGYSSPILAELAGARQLITQSQQFVIGLSPAGKLLWSVPYKTDYDQNSVSPVVVNDLLIVSGVQRGVTAYRIIKQGSELTPKEAWHTDEASFYMSTPVLAGKLLYGFSHLKSGQLICLDPRSGKLLWSGPGRQGENGALLSAGDTLLVLTTEPRLVFFSANGQKFQELARYTAASTAVWAHPVLMGGRVLVKDENSLTLWSLEEK